MTIHSSQGVTELLERWSEGDLGACWISNRSKRIVIRFDAGDTMIRYGLRQTNYIGLDSVGNLTVVLSRCARRHVTTFNSRPGWVFVSSLGGARASCLLLPG